jgi:hypothetical protein
MSSSTPGTSAITLHFDDGTLFATPNGGNARALEGTSIVWTADFAFTIEFATLTGGVSPPGAQSSGCSSSGGKNQVTLPLAAPAGGDAPSFKYTVKAGAGADARVLDPIIIIDKRPGGSGSG